MSFARWAHAELVLLVDDDEGEPRELDVLGEHRVGAHDQVHLARGDASRGLRARLAPQAPVEPRHAHLAAGEDPRHRRLVLSRQHLRGRHERGLRAVRDGREAGVRGHQRLAGAHVALEQAVHRCGPQEVRAHLGHHAVLGRREAEREAGADPPVERGREAEGKALEAAPQRPSAREQELVHEQLVEREAMPCAVGVPERVGEVHPPHRLVERRQALRDAHGLGQRVAEAPHAPERRPHGTPDARGRDPGRGRVHGDEATDPRMLLPRRLGQPFDGGRGELRAPGDAPEAPVQHHGDARHQRPREPRLVEPAGPHLARVVLAGHLDDAEAPPRAHHPRGEDAPDPGGLALGRQRRGARGSPTVLEAARREPEQIAHGHDAEPRVHLRPRGADAGQERHRIVGPDRDRARHELGLLASHRPSPEARVACSHESGYSARSRSRARARSASSRPCAPIHRRARARGAEAGPPSANRQSASRSPRAASSPRSTSSRQGAA